MIEFRLLRSRNFVENMKMKIALLRSATLYINNKIIKFNLAKTSSETDKA